MTPTTQLTTMPTIRSQTPEHGSTVTGETDRLSGTDQDLTDRVRAGDRSAEQVLYRTYAAAALRRARQLGAQPADAEDHVAEAFLRVFGQLRRGRGPADRFAPYLFTILRNLAADSYRGQHGRELPTDQLGVSIDLRTNQAETADVVEARMSVRAAMAALPPRWREVLWRVHVEGQSPAALAAEFGGTPQAASAVAFRARRALRLAYASA
jgi:RNA polymerase sigma factor (sigma-70 family)